MREISKEIEIDVSAPRVWQIFLDFRSFPEWNPFIKRIEGEPTVGARLNVVIQLPGRKGMTFRPRVLNVEPEKEFRWIGHLGIPGIFDGEHIFLIEPLGEERVRFVQKERFAGILAPLFLPSIAEATKQGFAEMNAALKLRAEKVENELP